MQFNKIVTNFAGFESKKMILEALQLSISTWQ